MIFLIDTCFISHLQELNTSNTLELREILLNNLVGITESVKKEFIHYQLEKFIPISKLIIIPIEDHDFKLVAEKYPDIQELDIADQTLWYLGYYQTSSEYVILTDDGELFSECYISKIPVLRLPDFVLFVVQNSKIPKNQASKCFKYWTKKKRYSKKDISYWVDILNKIT